MNGGFWCFGVCAHDVVTRIIHNNIRIGLLDTLPFGCQIRMQAVSPLGQRKGMPHHVAAGAMGSGRGNQIE
jgi:hypothetical protein